jgi:hypothetical protein
VGQWLANPLAENYYWNKNVLESKADMRTFTAQEIADNWLALLPRDLAESHEGDTSNLLNQPV